jgi:hypothetical protein
MGCRPTVSQSLRLPVSRIQTDAFALAGAEAITISEPLLAERVGLPVVAVVVRVRAGGWRVWLAPDDPPAWYRYLVARADRPSAIPERWSVVLSPVVLRNRAC